MRHIDEAALGRIRAAAVVLLAGRGLEIEPDLVLRVNASGAVAIADAAPMPGDPCTRLRRSTTLDADAQEADVVAALAAWSAEATRRRLMALGRIEARRRSRQTPGWTSLAHPLAIALTRRADEDDGLPLAACWSDHERPRGYGSRRTGDLIAFRIVVDAGRDLVTLDTQGGPGTTTMTIEGRFPDALAASLTGRPLSDVVASPPWIAQADSTTCERRRRHARRVRDACAALVIERATALEDHLRLELAPCVWTPYGPAPDVDTERMLAHNHERR